MLTYIQIHNIFLHTTASRYKDDYLSKNAANEKMNFLIYYSGFRYLILLFLTNFFLFTSRFFLLIRLFNYIIQITSTYMFCFISCFKILLYINMSSLILSIFDISISFCFNLNIYSCIYRI